MNKKKKPETEVGDPYVTKVNKEVAGKEAFDKIVTSILERVIQGRTSC